MASAPLTTCGIYLFDKNTDKVLICHATNASWTTWSIPKGLKDKKENAYAAAVRELEEETGIDLSHLHIISIATLEPVKYQKQNKVLESFLVVTDTSLRDHNFKCRSMINESMPEVDRWSWVTLDDMLLKVHETQRANYSQIRKLTGH
jgi:predicted NUDIX family NTP pyrophosphohydrolase